MRVLLLFALLASQAFGACAASWANGYALCFEVTLDHTKVPNTNLTDYVNLICFNGSASTNCDAVLGTLAQNALKIVASGGSVTDAGCFDCRWTSDNAGASLLNYENPSYVGATGLLNSYVQKTRSHTVDDKIYLFVGKTGATDQSNPAAVWAAYQNVHHLGTSSLIGTNSTGRLSPVPFALQPTPLTAHGATTTTGQISGGVTTNTGAYMRSDTDAGLVLNNNGPGAFSISCWIKTAMAADRGYCLTAGANTDTNGLRLGLASNCATPFAAEFSYGNVGTATGSSPGLCGAIALNDDAWHLLAGTVAANGDDMSLYVDGALVGTTNSTNHGINCSTNPLIIGRANDLSHLEDFLPGKIDEIRITGAIQLSADWNAADFNNQSSPSTFYSVAAPVGQTAFVRHRVAVQ